MAKKSKNKGGGDNVALMGTNYSFEDEQLGNILQKYELVEVVTPEHGDPYVLVTERTSNSPAPVELMDVTGVVDTREIGTASPSPFTSNFRREYNRDLQGIKGLRIYDAMRKSDGVVRGSLRSVKTSVLAAKWICEPNDPNKKADQEAADFVWWNLNEGMSISWSQVIAEATLMMDFGYYMFEIVWEERIVEGIKRLVVKKLAPRHPMDVKAWVFDRNGGPAGVWIYSDSAFINPGATVQYVPGGSLYNGGGGYDSGDAYYLDIDNLLVFTFDKEAGNIEGISVLRSAYKHWYYKEQLYKIDAIQKERHGIGIPIIKLPAGYGANDRANADELGRNLRTNERAHVVLPPMWELMFAKLEGHVVDALKSIEVHDAAIRTNVLAGFLSEHGQGKEHDQSMFLKATRFIADIVCDTFNLHLIPKIIANNFENVGQPVLKARRIGQNIDIRVLTFSLRNLVGAGILTPDDKLEAYLRDELDLPAMDFTTQRDAGPKSQVGTNAIVAPPAAPPAPAGATATPAVGASKKTPAAGPTPRGQKQANGRAGLPRQTPPSSTPPQAHGGKDSSGGA